MGFEMAMGYKTVTILDDSRQMAEGRIYNSMIIDGVAYDMKTVLGILSQRGFSRGIHYKLINIKYTLLDNNNQWTEVVIPTLSDLEGRPYYTMYPNQEVGELPEYENILYSMANDNIEEIRCYTSGIIIKSNQWKSWTPFSQIHQEISDAIEEEKQRKKAEKEKQAKKEELERKKKIAEEERLAKIEAIKKRKLEEETKTKETKIKEVKEDNTQPPTEIPPTEIPLEELLGKEEVEEMKARSEIEDTTTIKEEVQVLEMPEKLEEIADKPTVTKARYKFTNKIINDISREEVIERKNRILSGVSKEDFIPRVRMTARPLYVENEEELIKIYTGVKNKSTLYVDQETLNNISEHFGEDGFPLKVIFDAYHFEEIWAMLHISIEDPSPNYLYEGVYKHLYLYKIYSEEILGRDKDETSAYSVIKHLSLASLSQSSVGIEVRENEDDESSTNYLLETDPISESNTGLRNFLIYGLLNGPNKTNRIEDICKLAEENKYIRIQDDFLLYGIGVPNIDVIVRSSEIQILYAGTPLSGNVIGYLYNKTINNKRLLEAKEEPYTLRDIYEDIDYNKTLKKLQDSKHFETVYGITQYRPLTEVFNMDLEVDFILLPTIGGKRTPSPIGIVATDNNSLKRTKVLLPIFGDYLGKLKSLSLTINTNLESIYNSKFKTYSLHPKNVKDLRKEYGMKQVEIGNISSLDELEIVLNRTKLEGIVIPSFVKSSAESIERIYGLLGVF